MFLKKYTQLSAPKLLEQLNGNVHYQIFCDIYINPLRPLTNYKLIDDIASELADKLRIQQQQDILAEAWKPYMKDLDTFPKGLSRACVGRNTDGQREEPHGNHHEGVSSAEESL